MIRQTRTSFARGAVFLVLVIIAIMNTAVNFEDEPVKGAFRFYVGTYTRNESKGIYQYEIDVTGALKKIGLAVETENPSFLAKTQNGKYLIAANENSDDKGGGGTVSSFEIAGESLKFIDKKSSGGDSPCYLAVNSSGHVLAANYSSGNVGLLKITSSGSLEGPLDVFQHTGRGTNDRQKEPHAHSAWFIKETEVITVDLGTNELWFSRLDPATNKLKPSNPPKLAMEPGAGPRHMAFLPNGKIAYVINELNSTITILKAAKPGQFTVQGSVSTLPKDFKGENYCADIHVSPDGKFLYASNRGHNSLAIFQVGKNGELKAVGHESVRGDWPRNFAITPDGKYLVVANQRSNNLVSFRRDKKSGGLAQVQEIGAPSPVFLLF